MKGLIFMVIVTLLVLASFARPEKEIDKASTPSQTEKVGSVKSIDSSTSFSFRQ